MHTDLSPHLHTPECNKFINELRTCHAENKFLKFLGACNEFDTRVVRCLKQERIRRSAANRAASAERQQRLREKLREEATPNL